jgi:hypothetical protein
MAIDNIFIDNYKFRKYETEIWNLRKRNKIKIEAMDIKFRGGIEG